VSIKLGEDQLEFADYDLVEIDKAFYFENQ